MKSVPKFLLFFLIFVSTRSVSQTLSKLPMSLRTQFENAQAGEKNTISTIVVRGNKEKISNWIRINSLQENNWYGNITAIKLPSILLETIGNESFIDLIEDGNHPLHEMDDSANRNAKADSVHLGLGLKKAYYGDSVLIGLIDSGIDYTHPDFRNTNGTTRIEKLYDFNILTNYSEQQINASMINKSIVLDESGHGTHVLGVAAGNGILKTEYIGVAPKSKLLVADMTPSFPCIDVISAADSMFAFANSVNKACVINVSLGSNFGPHDGTDNFSVMIDTLIAKKKGQMVAFAAGNSGDSYPHLFMPSGSDTLFSYFSATNATSTLLNFYQFYLDAADAANFNIVIEADTTASATAKYYYSGTTNHYKPAQSLGILRTDSVFSRGKRFLGVVRMLCTTYSNGRLLVEIEIRTQSMTRTPLWAFRVTNRSAFHLWGNDRSIVFDPLVVARTMRPTAKFVYPNNQYSIAGTFQCSKYSIAVGNFRNRKEYISCANTLKSFNNFAGDLHQSSSQGPTIDNRIKPEITASGQNTIAASATYITKDPNMEANGCNHKIATGTSNAAPIVTGSIALYLQIYPNASFTEIKNSVINTATQDNFTGNIVSNNWGYGKINAFALTKSAEQASKVLSNSDWLFNLEKTNVGIKLSYKFDANNQSIFKYVVEKSTDSKTFYSISEVSNPTNFIYTYLDTENTQDKVYYRITAFKNGGQKTYSPIKLYDPKKETVNFQIYPNPATSNFTIQIGDKIGKDASISIININGKEILTKKLESSTENIECNFEKGVYFVRIKNNSSISHKKLILH